MDFPIVTDVAPGVKQLSLLGQHSINAYLIGDLLIDAGIRGSAGRLGALLQRHPIRAHALTHPHADHQGASHFVCSTFGVPLWVHGDGADIMEHGRLDTNIPHNPVTQLQRRFWAGPAHPVARTLQEGDDLNGFEVLSTPGHAQGHVSLWRHTDRVLIVGDVLTHMNVLTTRTGLHEPLRLFTLDEQQNRQSLRRLAALEPSLALFGHGPPLRDPEALARFAATL